MIFSGGNTKESKASEDKDLHRHTKGEDRNKENDYAVYGMLVWIKLNWKTVYAPEEGKCKETDTYDVQP